MNTEQTPMNPEDLQRFAQQMLEELPKHWKGLLATGIVMVITGSVGLILDVWTTIASVMFIAALLATGGAFQLVHALTHKEENWAGRSQHFLSAVIYLLGAGVILWKPMEATAALTLVLAGLFAAMGVIRIWYGLQYRNQAWKWLMPVLIGLLDLAMAVLITITWPQSSLWVIGVLVAVDLLMNGWFLVMIALRVRKGVQNPPDVSA